MPGLLNAPAPAVSPLAGSNAIWSKKRDHITFDQLQKFWNELPLQARQELLRIDKQALFEQARKNLYCSRCNGLLLEGFTQIVMYGKSLQQEGVMPRLPNRTGIASKAHINSEPDDIQDPSVHPWGGLAATKEGILTLLDCFINARSLKALQNVFDSARARERERELLYPDACGGGCRGWISQGMTNYGRGHGTRETCALHTARLSCDTLVDFWSALGEETRTSLLRMKEEDFIERLMYRFDSKRFCRDCRRNVIREFKELKELKRMRRELRCTSWFCVADTAFQYEVTEDTVQADWQQSFADTVGKYHHFEWAIGTGEGKSDVLEFEDVGMSGKVEVDGLDLGGLSACFITLRAWKLDGRCTEICVKAHALKGQLCVHRRLVIGDGYVTITKGESIRRFFEHAEEAEEEEDDDAMDKDGNEIDGDVSRSQKHAKSPELAREFLLDAATVIFKEQVEKAFREGTARQNAHSIFVSLALKLLEERVHVACKEIITLEKQIKLLEEEEKEKQEEEERRERRRAKEREKKLRRKERLKGKERERERKNNELECNSIHDDLPTYTNDSPTSTLETVNFGDSVSDPGETIKDEQSTNHCLDNENIKSDDLTHKCHIDEEFSVRDINESFILEQSKSSRRKSRFQASKWYEDNLHHDEYDTTMHRPLRERVVYTNPRTYSPKFNEKYHCASNRLRDRLSLRESKTPNKTEQFYRGREFIHVRQVWEPLDPRKKSTRIKPNSDITADQSEAIEFNKTDTRCSTEVSEKVSTSNGSGDLVINSSSSDNCSSCLSEGDNSSSSSGTQNAESSTTSDSEDASPQSEEGRDANFQKGEPRKNPAQISDDNNRGFGFFDTHQQQRHILPIFSSPAIGYINQNPIPWQFSQPNHFVYPANPISYSLPMPQYMPPPSLFNARVYEPVSVVKPIEKQVPKKQIPSKPRHEDSSPFSLFHYGGPIAGPIGFNVNSAKEENVACSKEDATIEEYSLFSGGSGVRFSIF